MCIYIFIYSYYIVYITIDNIQVFDSTNLFPYRYAARAGESYEAMGNSYAQLENPESIHLWRYRNVPSSKLPRQFGNEQWTQLEDIWTLSKTGIFQLAMLVYLSVSSLYKISDACHIRYLNPLVNIMENSWIGGGNSNIFYFHPYFGEDFQFDDHIFQRGWFNHQLEFFRCARVTGGCGQSFVCSHFQESYIYGLIF